MPTMSPEVPAGYFSTFSILDPNSSAEGQARAQKRNRRVFVCIPCHKRKLRCDKGLPCSRCVASGSSADCNYQPFPSAAKARPRAPEQVSREQSRTPPSIGPQERSKATYRARDGRAAVHGSTHWAKIASEVSAYHVLSCKERKRLLRNPKPEPKPKPKPKPKLGLRSLG